MWFESSVKLVWSPILTYIQCHLGQFESSVKLVWSPIVRANGTLWQMFESSVKLVWFTIHLSINSMKYPLFLYWFNQNCTFIYHQFCAYESIIYKLYFGFSVKEPILIVVYTIVLFDAVKYVSLVVAFESSVELEWSN